MPTPSTATAFGDADVAYLLADMGIAITVGGVNGIGLLDEADEVLVQDADRGQVVVLMDTLTVRTTDFPNAAIGQTVAIGSKNFTVRERLRTGDGALTKLLLGST
ncbi:MAG: head-tail joining protein [Candidatus Acidiferrales bacterium]